MGTGNWAKEGWQPTTDMDPTTQMQQLLAAPPAEEQRQRHAEVSAAASGGWRPWTWSQRCPGISNNCASDPAASLLHLCHCRHRRCLPLPAAPPVPASAALSPPAADCRAGAGGSPRCWRRQGQGRVCHPGGRCQQQAGRQHRCTAASTSPLFVVLPCSCSSLPPCCCASCRPLLPASCFSRNLRWRPSSTPQTGQVSSAVLPPSRLQHSTCVAMLVGLPAANTPPTSCHCLLQRHGCAATASGSSAALSSRLRGRSWQVSLPGDSALKCNCMDFTAGKRHALHLF